MNVAGKKVYLVSVLKYELYFWLESEKLMWLANFVFQNTLTIYQFFIYMYLTVINSIASTTKEI